MSRLLLSVLALLAVVWPSPDRPQIGLGAAPARVEVTATPGGRGSQQIVVSNSGQNDLEIAVTVEPYRGAGAGNRSAVGWLTVEPAHFTLRAGQQQAVTVRIALPRDGSLPSGGRYAQVVFQTAPLRGPQGAGLSGRLGVPFLFTVQGQGPLVERAELAELRPVLAGPGLVSLVALFVNQGNVHLFPHGHAELWPEAGEMSSRDLRETTAVLPEEEKELVTTSPLPVTPGGAYRARAVVEYGRDGRAGREVAFIASARPEIVALTAWEEERLTLQVKLRSTGGLWLQPYACFAVQDAEGIVTYGVACSGRGWLQPQGETTLATPYDGNLEAGVYTLAVQVEYGDGEPLRGSARFEKRTGRQATAPGWEVNAGRPQEEGKREERSRWLLVGMAGALLLLLLIVLILLLILWKRRPARS
jgi:hypothetical protein